LLRLGLARTQPNKGDPIRARTDFRARKAGFDFDYDRTCLLRGRLVNENGVGPACHLVLHLLTLLFMSNRANGHDSRHADYDQQADDEDQGSTVAGPRLQVVRHSQDPPIRYAKALLGLSSVHQRR